MKTRRIRWGREVAALATVLVTGLAALPLLGMSAERVSASESASARPESCVILDRKMTLYAVELPRVQPPRSPEGAPASEIRIGWGTTPDSASIPGPTIEMIEGECLEVTVVNEVPEETLHELAAKYPGKHANHDEVGVSLHVHGVKYTASSDGTVHSGSIVPPGQSRTYTWYAEPRLRLANGLITPGTAGYWWYHDHVAGTSHGTGGLESGLFGALIVRRAQDPRPDRTIPFFMTPDMTINLQEDPECPKDATLEDASPSCFIARKGERVEFVVVGIGNSSDFHTFHLHGHNWVDNRTGLFTSPTDETRVIDAKTTGPSESFGFQVIAGHEVGVGDWMIHCHVQNHSDHGMASFFRVIQ